MLKRTVALALLILFFATSSADAKEIVTEEALGGGVVNVTGKDSAGSRGPVKPATVKKGTGGSGGAWVDPYVGMDCIQVYLEANLDRCGGDTSAYCGANSPIAGLCDETTEPAAPANPTAGQAAQYAIDYFRSVPLPVPVPVMSAPEGTTGAVHQLNLQSDREVNFTDPETAFGQLYLYCYATYEVNWGDGTTETYTTSGDVYPNSAIKHSWSKRGTYPISVTARWSADWTFGQYSGTLSGLNTNGEIPAFPVGDLQAVITR